MLVSKMVDRPILEFTLMNTPLLRSSNEAERLAALRDLNILDTAPETQFDAICRTAQVLFGMPIALVSLLDEDRQWFKARCGLSHDATSRDVAFCNHTIQADEVLIVEDARDDARFKSNPLVTGEPGIRFYAGAPLILRSGIRVGSLCIIDTEPRRFSSEQGRQLRDLAEVVTANLRVYQDRTEHRRVAATLADTDDALRDARSRYASLADALPQMVWTVSPEDRVTAYRNASFRAYYGEADGSRGRAHSRNHPGDVDRMSSAWEAAVLGKQAFELEGRLRRHDGDYRWHRIVMIPLKRSGEVIEWLGTALDIDHIIAAQTALKATGDLLRLAQEAAEAGIWEWDMRDDVVRLSSMSARMHNLPVPVGQDAMEIPLADWKVQVHPDDLPKVWDEVKRAIADRTTYSCEFRIANPAVPAEPRWMQSFGRMLDDAAGEPVRCVGLQIDITDRKVSEARIAHVASHDNLTDLPNRVVFHATLERCLADLGNGQAALLCLDLDRFKTVNDTLGHHAGDRLLRVVADRLRDSVGNEGVIARLGGDEFAIILPGDGLETAQALARTVIDAIGQPIHLGSQVVTIGASIGIALAPEHGLEVDLLHRHADLALYRAKGAGRNSSQVYTKGMDEALEDRNKLEFDMHLAHRKAEFRLYYQPVVALTDGQVRGFEALMRWPHPIRGMVSPAEFIPIAEETGLVVPLGTWALEEACRFAASWPIQARIAVNVSAVQFQQPGLEAAVANALAVSGLAANRLELEITESLMIQDGDAVIACLHRLRSIGVRIALDDFGTGYSSLSYLRRFPFDKIKIDRSFVREIDDPDAQAIVRAVVSIGERLGTAITAEGVETEDQLALVTQTGCTEVQGFLFGKPMTPEQALAIMREQTPRKAA
ncbi:EAL domain-containing protein [Methylobacterium sp. J-092]|uniref:sensor domain-containing phosphodiesterase n=1 Tax=Methylobacterium sp. J-092 TaxID=2836667 RepID=UPI001FB87EB3|nr:EAL domain-containing protein [Methylobacterium sp. J-092]MCJ2006046.1 EAL domain-containing protein [Methylobacterium sp. J-092]